MAMTETEYLKVTNRVNVSMALAILRNVLTGDDYGITQHELSDIVARLARAEEKLFSLVEISEG